MTMPRKRQTDEGIPRRAASPPLPVQCRRCLVRLSGPLAGWQAEHVLPGYQQVLCAACEYELAQEDLDG